MHRRTAAIALVLLHAAAGAVRLLAGEALADVMYSCNNFNGIYDHFETLVEQEHWGETGRDSCNQTDRSDMKAGRPSKAAERSLSVCGKSMNLIQLCVSVTEYRTSTVLSDVRVV